MLILKILLSYIVVCYIFAFIVSFLAVKEKSDKNEIMTQEEKQYLNFFKLVAPVITPLFIIEWLRLKIWKK